MCYLQLLLVLSFICPLFIALGLRPLKSPNIILIVADDLGYNEANFMNQSRGILTPNLDLLASNGVKLSNFYTSSLCTPTRASLLTGRYPNRLATQANVLFWDTPWGIDLNETFISEELQSLNYATALFGKWHIGMFSKEYTPLFRGFDRFNGYLQGCQSHSTHESACCHPNNSMGDRNYVCQPTPFVKDCRGYDWWAGLQADVSANHTSSATIITEQAIDFIQHHHTHVASASSSSSSPFFMLLAFQNVHIPYTVEERFRDLYQDYQNITESEQTLWGYISEMDEKIGEILTCLKRVELDDNTVIIFMSDNGAPHAYPDLDHSYSRNSTVGEQWTVRNYPFRGWKNTLWEGGIRTPAFISSASARDGLLPVHLRGTTNQHLFGVIDIYPTLVNLASIGAINDSDGMPSEPRITHQNRVGVKPARKLDGKDIWPSIVSDGSSKPPHDELLLSLNPLCEDHGSLRRPPQAAIRVGKWKLLTWCYEIEGINGANHTGPKKAPSGILDYGQGPVLYNLQLDESETKNVAALYPNVVDKLLERLLTYADPEENVEPQQPFPPFAGEQYFCKACPQRPSLNDPTVEAWAPWLDLAQYKNLDVNKDVVNVTMVSLA